MQAIKTELSVLRKQKNLKNSRKTHNMTINTTNAAKNRNEKII